MAARNKPADLVRRLVPMPALAVAMLALAAPAVAGCGVGATGTVYHAKAGQVGTVHLNAIESPSGRIELDLTKNVHCQGDFADVPAQVLHVGDIEPNLFMPFQREGRGARAVLACSDGRVVRCALMRRVEVDRKGGFGACRDGAGDDYSLFF